MAVRPIDANELLGIERLLDTDVVRQSKTASWLLDQVLHDIQAMPTLTPPNEPLTLEQLREMDGQPAWCEDVGRWAIVSVSDAGKWKGVPFALFVRDGGRFEWDIEDHGLCMHPYPPAQQRWIPVSERLPDPLEDVLVKCKTSMGRSYECIAQYIVPGTAKDEADVEWDWEVLDYNEKRDVYVVQPGWYESVKNWDEYGLCGILDIVTHWMPLPEPPEEG